MSSITHTPIDTQKMPQDVFSQLYQALSPATGAPAQESSSVFDEWLKQDFLSEYSANSSPEIATPLDQFLMSPPYDAKEEVDVSNACLFDNVDLDVSAILESPTPQFFLPAAPTTSETSVSPPTPAVSVSATPAVTSAVATPTPDNMASLFADIGESLPAALAALAAVASPSALLSAATGTTTASAAMSPATASARSPAFSASPARSRKRASEEIDPADDAAVKRQKNTDAARRSRLRKVQKMESLELRVSELEKINAGLLMRVAVLDSEKTNLKAKESSYESRIKVLEEQLAEAHKALSSRP
ncbi:hypothetical protein A0J61_05781 [Choanephora cucurbitarum]|uniref:BZIP domain-containing protein n=1 Tax=Choanephora cucurbitarum TaxID=101091 RepID=A0A1C7NBN4_9FUNG|nr:hypothetical protein A0J61_05781 [Choanephora cucurbitarum]